MIHIGVKSCLKHLIKKKKKVLMMSMQKKGPRCVTVQS